MNDFFIRRFPYGVGDQQNLSAHNHPQSLPSQLPVYFAVLTGDLIWIVEDQDRSLKANAVLPLVDAVLALIPSKSQNGSLVLTIMYIYYCISKLTARWVSDRRTGMGI